MLKLCRVDLDRSEEIFKKIDKYVERVASEFDPQCVILFGSFARGDISEASDVDLLVVADFKEGVLDRIKTLLDFNDDLGLPLEPVGYTPKEFEEMREKGNPFILDLLEKGKVLYEKQRKSSTP
jgi:hypothetical protein